MESTASMIETLPQSSSLSPSLLSFLNEKLGTCDDLRQASALVSELQSQSYALDQCLSHLNRRLQACVVAYASFSDEIHAKLDDVRLSTSISGSSSVGLWNLAFVDGALGRSDKVLGEELPSLAKEVARVEAVRVYAETALKLDTLVGDIEDAVSSVVNRNMRKPSARQNSEEIRLIAIKALKQTENVLTSIIRTRPQWVRLVSAVDHRVDRALAIIRPQAIADHRALLASLGWPPPLSTLNSSSPDTNKSMDVLNLLFTMQGDLKHQYCENFLALCSLQELQRQRKSRQLEGHNLEVALYQPLWAIEELVNPIFIASQIHFAKWIDKPEFIFALVYKITRDYVDSMDELLQPLVDEAMLTGYSCREEWVSAMVTSLSTYLAKEIFPMYVDQLGEEGVIGTQSQARIYWLNLIDLMISFDKQVHSLVSHSGILISLEEDGNLQKISSLSVFCDRPDWLDLWAEIELSDTLDKLKHETENERSWSTKLQAAALLSGSEDYKSPAISTAFLHHFSSIIDRCRLLPTVSLRSKFVRLAGAPTIHKFVESLLFRCQEAEGLTALTDDDSLNKVSRCINAARHIESSLTEWCEDVFYLEMGLNYGEQLVAGSGDDGSRGGPVEGPGSGILDEEIGKLEQFRTEWVGRLSTVILRGFDAHSRDYIKNRKQWHGKGEEGWTVSKSFVGALDYLQVKMSLMEESLNGRDFVGVWRNLAMGVDQLIYNGILMNNVKFYDAGVERLGNDLSVLFGVFGAWCLRPEGFFPRASEGLKLLKMAEKQIQGRSSGGAKWLTENGIRHFTATEVEKLVKNRVYTS